MYHILPIVKIVTYITVGIGIIITLFVVVISGKKDPWDIISTAGTITFFVDIFILLFSNKIWILISKKGSKFYDFEDKFFPNINGEWIGEIEHEEGTISCQAIIKQDLQSIDIRLLTETSDSYTLIAYPSKRDNNKIIYYAYRCIPNKSTYEPYEGSTILYINKESNNIIMKGHYITTRKKGGLIKLSRK